MRVAYRDEPTVGVPVNLVHSWERDEVSEPVMSASSGPKAYMRNDVWKVFQRDPAGTYVLMVRGEYARSVPFLLVVDTHGFVFDMSGKEVVIER